MAALSIFLAAHIMYILGFSQGLTLPGWGAAFPLSGLIVADFFAYHRLRQALVARTKGRWLRFPIHLYQIIISLMLLTALQTLWRADWPGSSAWLASAGALLFFVSDTILAYNRFVALIRGEAGNYCHIPPGQAALISACCCVDRVHLSSGRKPSPSASMRLTYDHESLRVDFAHQLLELVDFGARDDDIKHWAVLSGVGTGTLQNGHAALENLYGAGNLLWHAGDDQAVRNTLDPSEAASAARPEM